MVLIWAGQCPQLSQAPKYYIILKLRVLFVEDVIFVRAGSDGAIPGEHDFSLIHPLHFTHDVPLGAFQSIQVRSASPDKQKESNREKSKTRARVEHIFGFVENSMNGSFIRTIGMARAKAKIGMMNLVYNICRCTQLKITVCMG